MFVYSAFVACEQRVGPDQPEHPHILIRAFKYLKVYSKTCVKLPLSTTPKIGFQDQLWLNAGKKYCKMLLGENPGNTSGPLADSHEIKGFL